MIEAGGLQSVVLVGWLVRSFVGVFVSSGGAALCAPAGGGAFSSLLFVSSFYQLPCICTTKNIETHYKQN